MEADVNAQTMRRNAKSCLSLAENAANEPAQKRFMRMADAWKTLADNQDWLDGVDRPNDGPRQPELHNAA